MYRMGTIVNPWQAPRRHDKTLTRNEMKVIINLDIMRIGQRQGGLVPRWATSSRT